MMTTHPTTLKPYADAREVAGMERPARDANLQTLVMTGKVPVMVPTRNAPVPNMVRTALKRNQGNDIRPMDQGFPHIFKKHRTKKRCFLVKNILKG